MKKQTFKLIFILVAGIFGIAILAGCPSSELGGVRTTNLTPWVEWSNTPQDSMQHSANPLLTWFGADGDGQIVDYQYAVMLSEDVDSYGGIGQIVSDFPESVEWNSLGNITEAVIPLFASEDTSEYVDQFVFLKCLDDSDFYSEIIYLFLSRNNHPPTCNVTVPEGPRWCLPDTNDFWQGIGVSWEGKDSLDYEGIQPDFLWHVRMYGPFSTLPDSTDTLGQYLYGVLVDGGTGIDTVTITSYDLTDLETGWYILYVKNFDDAHVASIPALGIFEVYEPNWVRHPEETKDILVINHSAFFRNSPGSLNPDWEDSVRVFYERIIADAGFSQDQWDWTDDENPPRSILYNYRMLIVDDIDYREKLDADPETTFLEYLSVGGKIWVIGRFSYATVGGQTGRLDYGLIDTAHPMALTYMDLSAARFPINSLSYAEFIGARPILTGMPTLEIDTFLVQQTNFGPFTFDALARVEHLIRFSTSEPLFVFVSNDPNSVGTFHGFPVAIRYETATFKTSYFSFPLFFIKYDQASNVADQMLAWFLEE